MKNANIIKLGLVFSTAGLLAAGCAVRATGPGGAVEVSSEPPVAPVEVQTPAPGPDFVWVGGEWGWDNDRWAWHGGHWDHPPYRGAHWRRGHYETRNGHRVYRRGGWR